MCGLDPRIQDVEKRSVVIPDAAQAAIRNLENGIWRMMR